MKHVELTRNQDGSYLNYSKRSETDNWRTLKSDRNKPERK
jgi:hypothetical protein